jgi:hypothetical protein
MECFGFYSGGADCRSGCKLALQCKAIVNSDGLDVVSDIIEELLETLPNKAFVNGGTIVSDVAQLVSTQDLISVDKAKLTATMEMSKEKLPNALGITDDVIIKLL